MSVRFFKFSHVLPCTALITVKSFSNAPRCWMQVLVLLDVGREPKRLAKVDEPVRLAEQHPMLYVEFEIQIVEGVVLLFEIVGNESHTPRRLGHRVVAADSYQGFA